MAGTGIIHHVGTFFLLGAWVLLLVVSISSPVVNNIGILKVTLTNQTNIRNSSVTFGSWGYCILDVPPRNSEQDFCSGSHIGYHPTTVMANIEKTKFASGTASTVNNLTNAMVLHPVCAIIAFVAFCLAFGSGVIGSLLAAIVACLAWIVTLIIMVIDFSIFGVVKNHVNDDNSGSHAYYHHGMWFILAAMLALFFAQFILLFSCFSRRRHRRADRASKYETEGATYTRRRKRFIFF